jgi:hypothetical protein
MSVEAPIYPADAAQVVIGPVDSLPPDFFDRTVAVARGPVGDPETGYGSVVDFMPHGYAIQKNPEPVAVGVFEAPSTEAVLESMFESPDSGPRFAPYGRHMEDAGQDSTLAKGIALVSEQGVVKPVLAEVEPAGETPEDADKDSGLAKNLLTALRRSRLGKVAAVTAIATGELLSLSSGSAQGADAQLEQECVQAALKRPQILKKGIKHAGRHSQTGVLIARYDAMPEKCYDGDGDDYMRSSSARVQAFRNGKWLNISYEGGVVNQTYNDDGSFDPKPQTAYKGELQQPPNGHAPDWWYHPCRTRILLREVVSRPLQRNGDSGYIPNPPVATKIYKIGIPPNNIRPHSFRRNNC